MEISFFSVQFLQLKKTEKLFSILLVALLTSAGFAPLALADYPLARVKNNTEYTVSGEVQYVSGLCSDDSYRVAPGSTWTASSRGVCLIDDITGSTGGAIGKYGESTSITPYHASPATSYSGFQINAFSGSYRIFSADEWKKVSNTNQGKSPGFYFVNKTAWPLTYSLDQVGCLYHGIIPAGEGVKGVRRLDTGAVWFTLKVAIQPDGIDPVSNWDCVKPVAELVGDVALAAVTGGTTAVAKAGGKVIVKQVAIEAVKAGARKAIKSAAKKVIKDLGKKELGKLLSGAGSVELYGQYAGYEWPFRCDNMPEYHIVGGPVPVRDEDGEVYLQRGTPFKVSKVNDCGDDMMLGSRRSMESDQSAFSEWPGGAGDSLPEIGGKLCATFYKGTNSGGESLQLCGVNSITPIPKDFSIPFRNNVMSLKCNSGIKSVLLLNQREPIKVFSCKGGNIINTDGSFNLATAAVFYTEPCCGDGPKPLTATQQAASAKASAEVRASAEATAAAVRAAEQKAMQDRVNAENASLSAGWAANASKLYGNCSLRGTIGSVDNPGDEATAIRMFNKGSTNINIYWINPQGEEVNYASQDAPIRSIESGPAGDEEYGASGYWYIAVDDSGECVGIGNSMESNGQFDFDPDLVVPGANPRKVVFSSDGSDQGGYMDDGYGNADPNDYADDQTGVDDYVDPNDYADYQSGVDDYVDPNDYADDQTGYADQGVYQEGTSDYIDPSEYQGNATEGPGCEYLGQLASTDEGEIIDVQFENYTDDTIGIYWINGRGEASNYSADGGAVVTISALSYQTVRTKIGHIFAASDANGTCLGVTSASASGETIGFSPLQ